MADEPRTWIVSQDGTGDFGSIQPALDAARPGDTVLARAGVYAQDLRLSQGVTLRGEGAERTRLVAGVSDAMTAEQITDAAVCDLSVDGADKEGRTVIWIISASVSVLRCTVIKGGLHGIEAKDGAHLTLQGCTIRDNKSCGVLIWQDAECDMVENSIVENGLHGVVAMDRGRVMMRANTIGGSKHCGVMIHQDGEGELEENTITNNERHGIVVMDRGRAIAQNNTIVSNAECGVWVYKEATATLRHNIIAYNSKWGGVRIIDREGDQLSGAVSLIRNCLWSNNPDYAGQMDAGDDLVADPCFVDARGGDFHLLPDSPCIGAGFNGEDLGALPFKREAQPLPAILSDDSLYVHLRSLPLAHTVPPTPARPAAWLRCAAAVGARLPLCLAQDLGALLTQPRRGLSLARPSHLPAELDTAAYLNFLNRLAARPLLREVSSWDISEAVAGVALARLVAGVSFPDDYALPAGAKAAGFARRLAFELEGADPARIWREAGRADRPDLARLLPASAMARIEANLRQLDADELRFLHRYGPRFSGAPDPRSLLDLFNLLQLPPAARLAMAQVLKLLPRVSEAASVGGMQTYSMGGYGGITRKGNLDNLLLTELAYPEEMLFHRLLNREALYYGREAERERRRELAYIVTQMGVEMKGDGEALARALTLALAQTMQRRGYEVLQSFVGSEWSAPEPMNRPMDVQRVLYYRDDGWARTEEMLGRVARQMREWGERYRGIQALWVVGEHWDADEWEEHAGLYGELKSRGGQQAWFVRVGNGNRGRRPVAAAGFERYEVVGNEIMWSDPAPAPKPFRPPPSGEAPALIRYDGLYHSQSTLPGLNEYLRFFPDGAVLESGSWQESPDQASEWLRWDPLEDSAVLYPRVYQGRYTVRDSTIEISTELPDGMIKYSGSIMGASLILDWHSSVNDGSGHQEYRFVAVPLAPLA